MDHAKTGETCVSLVGTSPKWRSYRRRSNSFGLEFGSLRIPVIILLHRHSKGFSPVHRNSPHHQGFPPHPIPPTQASEIPLQVPALVDSLCVSHVNGVQSRTNVAKARYLLDSADLSNQQTSDYGTSPDLEVNLFLGVIDLILTYFTLRNLPSS